jgi:hypothetical protein
MTGIRAVLPVGSTPGTKSDVVIADAENARVLTWVVPSHTVATPISGYFRRNRGYMSTNSRIRILGSLTSMTHEGFARAQPGIPLIVHTPVTVMDEVEETEADGEIARSMGLFAYVRVDWPTLRDLLPRK